MKNYNNSKSNFSILENYILSRKENSNYYSLIAKILLKYNCRINEILKAKWENFIPGRFLILIGSKGSANVIIRDTMILESINSLPRIDPILLFPFITYYQIYHEIKKKYSHLLKNISHKKNLKITHSFRYLNVEGIADDKIIKDILFYIINKT